MVYFYRIILLAIARVSADSSNNLRHDITELVKCRTSYMQQQHKQFRECLSQSRQHYFHLLSQLWIACDGGFPR